MRNLLISTAVFACLAAPVAAGPKTKVSILFQNFPQGTVCGVSGAAGNVKLGKKKGHPKVDVKGYGEVGTYYCNLPDGRQIVTDVNARIPQNTRSAGVTVYPDGQAYVTVSTSDGQLLQLQFSNTVRGL
ncbi:hypothetical protein [Thalassovita mangrovi]|uniref:Uncharacterized protein n=1 Tax=Thalassovita mangrovi TaxID=2692236 RepID=A0A6L8LN02_9RHOB|nr:hypothetical protein [Thalassovita mangrovi]MYM54519.1 hypothetical protein [Thalassovita mangrovi]